MISTSKFKSKTTRDSLVLLAILFFSLNVLGQITLTPNSASMNAAPESNVMTAQGNGLVVQKKYTLTTEDPNLQINNLTCPSFYVMSSAGILKDPDGDNPYGVGTYTNCGTTVYGNHNYLLTFTQLDLGVGDTVSILTGFGQIKFSNNTIPPPFFIEPYSFPTLKGFTVEFKTNGDASVGQGFVLKYQAIIDNTPVSSNFSNFLGGNSLLFDASNGSLNAGLLSSNQPKGDYSVGLGYNPKNSGDYSVSIGIVNETSADFSYSIGYINKNLGNNTFSFGGRNTINYQNGFALGIENTISGLGAKAFGNNLHSKAVDGVVVGVNNDITDNPNPNAFSTTDRIFQVGNGGFSRRNALTILRNGEVGIGSSTQALTPDSRLVVDGFTRLGVDAPKIKVKEVSIPDNNPVSNITTVPHGIGDKEKILEMNIHILSNNNLYIATGYTNPFRFTYSFDDSNVYIYNVAGESANIVGTGRKIKILITYTE